MKFWVKVFLSTVIVMAAAFGAMGYALVTAAGEATLAQERQRALEAGHMVRVVLQNSVPEGSLPGDEALEEQMARVATGDFAAARLYGHDARLIYGNEGDAAALLAAAGESGAQAHRVERAGEAYLLEVVTPLTLGGRSCYLYTVRDIAWVYRQQDQMFASCAVITAIALAAAAVVMAVVCRLLTDPIRRLSLTTRRIAAGEYGRRAVVKGHDEVSALTEDFNRMADALCAHMEQLKEEARRREDFVASFAHELKTPLTSIIGYADMLRSRSLAPERAFESANYIYKEGRRLEGLSLKLLELIVLGRQAFERRKANGRLLCEGAAAAAGPALKEKYGVTLKCRAGNGVVRVEPDLIATLLINLLDNAGKASEPGQEVLLQGRARPDGQYVFAVTDLGCGIPQEELRRITEAFYMVDKSRARAQNGAGLGLALCAEIAQLHESALEFTSTVGKGTTVLLALPLVREDADARA